MQHCVNNQSSSSLHEDKFSPNSSFWLYEDSSLPNSAVHSSEKNISANCVNNFSHSLKCAKSNNKREQVNVSQEITSATNVCSSFNKNGYVNQITKKSLAKEFVSHVNNANRNVCIPNPDVQSVKLYSLNVCGLTTKLNLEEICANYDILCFTESQLYYIDVVNIPAFVHLPHLNRFGDNRHSGGIIIFVKEQLFSS